MADDAASHSTESLSSPGQTTPTSSVGDGPVASPRNETTLRLENENSSPRDDHVNQHHDSTLNTSPEEASARPMPVDPALPVAVTQDSSTECTPPSQAPPVTTHAPAPSAPMSSLSIARQFGSPRPGNGEVLDMICIGFGPASLAIAIALADRCSAASPSHLPRVLFLEKQRAFSWHAGMQLPDAHMQISFLKDLATPRDPTSPFSFLNYLHLKGRLQKFINLGTFLPARNEYEDYMRWCAEHFHDSVRYGCEATTVEHLTNPSTSLVDTFKVHWKDGYTNTDTATDHALARHVIVATGGSPFVPPLFKPFTSGPFPRFLHSSQYATTINSLERILAEPDAILHELNAALDELNPPTTHVTLPPSLASEAISSMRLSFQSPCPPPPQLTPSETATLHAKIPTLRNTHATLRTGLSSIGLHPLPLRFLVIGGGQSAAEIYTDLTTRFPSSSVHLLVKGSSLRPSDDSPFVNEIFDPNRVDSIYAQPATSRAAALISDRATNYGVVRIDLLERMYAALYAQGIHEPDESKWRCRILSGRTVVSVSNAADGRGVEVVVVPTEDLEISPSGAEAMAREEKMHATMVFFATGYVRDAHERLLDGTRELLVDSGHGQSGKSFEVGRDYRVKYDSEKVDGRAGVWLQGCNEKTHGLSDTLLSILAHRGGEMVQSIFGETLGR